MYYNIESLLLLYRLEDYLPFMSDYDIIRILEFGITPSAMEIGLWAVMKDARDRAVNERLKKAISGQKK